MGQNFHNLKTFISKITAWGISSMLLIVTLSSAAVASFSDVKTSNDYYDAISYLEGVGVVKGYSDGTFKPGNPINRAETMKILVEGLGITPDTEDYSNCFYDVGEEWFAPYICYAKSKGWVKGYGDGYFRPANTVNRVEAVKMVINIEGFEGELSSGSVLLPFNDTDSSQWYAVYLEAADDLRLLTESSGAFYPANDTTRGYLSEMIFRGLVIKGTGVNSYTEAAKEDFLNPEAEVYIPASTETTYAESLVENKEVFVISDENWEDVLAFLPAVQNHPYLIVHNSNGVLDIDSAIYFIEDYDPSRITLIGDFGSAQNYFEDYAEVNAIELVDTLEYWEGFDSVVYASSNYESSLISAPLAAFKEVPFVVEGSIFDREEVFENRIVYLVDGTQCPDLAESCVEMDSLDVQEELLSFVDREKLILVDPSDIDAEQSLDGFESAISGEPIEDGLSKDSLAAVVLAVQKEELLLPIGFSTVSSTQNDIEDFIDSLNLEPEYLTIVSNPNFIHQASYDEESETYYELDNSHYGDLNGDQLVDLKVGRIYGVTSTDTSSTIARSIYYDELGVSDNASLLWAPDFIQMLSLTYELESWLQRAGYDPTVHSKGNMDCESWEECFRDLEFDLKEALENQFLVVYQSHGSTSGGLMNFNTSSLRDEDIRLNSSIVMTSACSTCAYAKTNSPDNLFCLNMLRRGAVAYFGAVEDSSSNIDLPRDSIYGLLDGGSLGEVLSSFKERSYYRTRITSADTAPRFFDSDFILLGDPTLTPSNDRLSSLDLEDSIQFDGTTVTIEMPAVQTDHQFDFSFYSQSSSERNFYGTAYFEDRASTLVSDYSLIGEITNSQNGSTETRTSYEYLFSLPVSVDSITNFSIDYADGREALSEEVSFVEDEEGNTWFWLTDVVDDINDSGGMPARTITFDLE